MGASLTWDGADTKVTSSATTSLTTMTVCAWTYRTSDGESNLGRLFDKRVAGSQVMVAFNNASQVNLELNVNFSGGIAVWRPQTNTWPTNAWTHLAFTYDNSSATNDPIFYVNGAVSALSQDSNTTGTVSTNSDAYVIGNRGSQERTFAGQIAYFKIYDRILTPQEILEVMQNPNSIPSGCILYDQLLGTADPDLSGSGNTWTYTTITDSANGPPVFLTTAGGQ